MVNVVMSHMKVNQYVRIVNTLTHSNKNKLNFTLCVLVYYLLLLFCRKRRREEMEKKIEMRLKVGCYVVEKGKKNNNGIHTKNNK